MSTAQLHQDLWVLAETKRKRGGYFVEVGAFDGIELSNTYLLEKEFGWTGILVEPNPDCHAPLRQHRAATISTKAISAKRGSVDFLRVQDEPEFSGIASHASDDNHARYRREHSDVISVETITLDDLLREHAAPPQIDYMSIDTEGNEFEMLSVFDFARHRVDLLSVEHNYGMREQAIEGLLREHGFRRVHRRISRFDAWYKRTR
jgi:FkbM family methyltransferase